MKYVPMYEQTYSHKYINSEHVFRFKLPCEVGVAYQTEQKRESRPEKWLSAPFHFIKDVIARSITHPSGTNERFKCSLEHLEGMSQRLQVLYIILEGVVQDRVHFGPFLQAVHPNRG